MQKEVNLREEVSGRRVTHDPEIPLAGIYLK